MFIHTETVVYIYIGVCSCMLLFNILLIFVRRSEGKVRDIYIRFYRRLMDEVMQREEKQLYEKESRQLDRRLRVVSQLRAFHIAVMKKTEENESQGYEFLELCKPIFIRLSRVYLQKDHMYQAYFAYLMSQYKICGITDDNAIVDMMRKLVYSNSAYCRENALKALYSFGNEKNVYYAMKSMNDNGIFHHTKLITDGLLTFAGNQKLMAFMLYNNIAGFRVDYQVSFINYIRVVSGSYQERFYQLLLKQSVDKEVKIALVRYFSKYPYHPVKKLLIEFIKTATSSDWELAAVSTSVLREYQGKDVIETLTQALLHANWYIRYNAAESLYHKNISFQELSSIYNGDNRYAREMLEYQRQKHQINRQIKENKVIV